MLKLEGLEEFQRAINSFTEKVENLPIKACKIIMLELNKATILNTPVDTGRLVGAWQISLSDQPSFTANKYKDGKDRKSQENSVKSNQMNFNVSNVEKFQGGLMWLANNVEYAKYQEYGTGKLRGKFMLTRAIQEVQTNLNYQAIL